MNPQERAGDWIATYTGKRFWPLDPRPEDICEEDIAHALSMICRYNGHCTFFYSVAQHSLLCLQEAALRNYSQRIRTLVLLHDAAEAYVSDVSRPLKPFLPGFKQIEHGILDAIFTYFKVKAPDEIEKKIIKDIDNTLLATEGRVLMPQLTWWAGMKPSRYIDDISEIDIEEARNLFLWELRMVSNGEGRP